MANENDFRFKRIHLYELYIINNPQHYQGHPASATGVLCLAFLVGAYQRQTGNGVNTGCCLHICCTILYARISVQILFK